MDDERCAHDDAELIMKITFPESLDSLNLRPDRQAKNEAERSHAIRTDDILYIVDELEKKVGSNNSADPDSLDYRIAILEERSLAHDAVLALQRSAVAVLQSLVKALSFRSNKTDVAAAGTFVPFSSPLNSGYIIIGTCYNASGEMAGYVITDQSSSGFTVTPDQDGTLEWIAVQMNYEL
jgi:hypothetical protein